MDTPEEELNMNDIASKHGSEDSEEEGKNDSSSVDGDNEDEMAPPPAPQKVCPISFWLP